MSAVCRLTAQPLWQVPGHRRTSSEVGEEYGISQAYGVAHVVRLRGRSVQRHYMRHENNDSPAGREYDLQCALHRLRIF